MRTLELLLFAVALLETAQIILQIALAAAQIRINRQQREWNQAVRVGLDALNKRLNLRSL
jgi:hypothetical protein